MKKIKQKKVIEDMSQEKHIVTFFHPNVTYRGNTYSTSTQQPWKCARRPMSPPQMCLARRQWQALQMITATLSTLGHSVSF